MNVAVTPSRMRNAGACESLARLLLQWIMFKYRYNVLRSVMAVALLAAVNSGSATNPALQSGAMPARLTTEGGTFAIAMKSNPAPVPLNEPFELTVDVSLLKKVDDRNPLWLGLQATMPEHAHGMNTRARVEPLSDGKFVIKGLLFHMAGEWEVTFQVAKGRITEQARTRVLVE
jgi:hypothetical protein